MKITIDDREIEADEGETVIHAARRHGIEIPHFCWHDRLSVAGSCRLCLVKVQGIPKLQPACNVVCAPKMSVETDSAEVRSARQQVMQFLMLNHPVDCGICDKAGECSLQDNQMRYGVPESRSFEVKLHKRKLVPLSPRISLDNERCILCSRCVRFTREISKSHQLGIVERGSRSFVERLGESFDDPYSDNVIGICPTGALLSADFLYRSRVWFLEPVRSVCTGCARGCSIEVWRRRKERLSAQPGAGDASRIYRITALDNPEINGPWLCNRGFDEHKAMSRERLLQPLVGGKPAALDDAIAAARGLIAEARRPAVLVSSQASNEELDAWIAAFGTRLAAYVRSDRQPQPGEVVEDDFLIRADKNPNRAGAEARFGRREWDATAGHDLVVVWGEFDDFAALGDARTVHLATFGAPAHGRDVALPLSTTFERWGTFTNFEGKLNRFDAIFDKPAGVIDAAELFPRLAP